MAEDLTQSRIAICDDKEQDLHMVKEQIEEVVADVCPSMHLNIHLYDSGEKLFEDGLEKSFDLIFLDIEMPGLDGFTVAKRLNSYHYHTHLVFVSSYENYVYDSFDYSPLGFVRKSTLKRDLKKVLQKYFQVTAKRRLSYKVRDGFGICEVLLNDIQYFEGVGHSVIIKAVDKVYHTYGSLKRVGEELGGDNFIRVHRNYILNKEYISNVGSKEIELLNGVKIPMSKDRKKSIREEMIKYVRRMG